MCIAIVTKPGKEITMEALKNSMDNNPDGFGLAFVDKEGKLKVYKTLDKDVFVKMYEKVTKNFPDSAKLIHCRIRTHGDIDINNCHPFIVDANHAFIHNGTIAFTSPSDALSKHSDTALFNHQILKRFSALDKNWASQKWIQAILSKLIDYSKIAILNTKNEVVILNESKGTWVDDVWYSNDSYKESYFRSFNMPKKHRTAHEIAEDTRLAAKRERLISDAPGATYTIQNYMGDWYAAKYNQSKLFTEVFDPQFNLWRKWNNIEKMFDYRWEREHQCTPRQLGLIDDAGQKHKNPAPTSNLVALPAPKRKEVELDCNICGDPTPWDEIEDVTTSYGTFAMCPLCKKRYETHGFSACN